jgi:hypothetical protein
MGAGGGAGLLQRIAGNEADDDRPKADPDGKAAFEYLSEIREAAFEPLRVWTETLGHYPELSENAAKHAAYLQLNPDQKSAWPDAHEEYAECEGFSPEGAWSGGHSVIAFDGDVEDSIDAWMATFYHRLPLLEPGLCGVGAAVDGDVVVMDTGSLLNDYQGPAHVKWPHEDQRGVPLRWRPESPNPVPGEDQSTWGYPITLGVWRPEGKSMPRIEMELHAGKENGPIVPCHFSTPDAPTNPQLAPEYSWCLMPKQHLSPGSQYTVVAKFVGEGERMIWSFRTGSR